MTLSMADAVRTIAPQCKPLYLDALAANVAKFDDYGLVTSLRQSHFLAQFLCETGGGTVTQENMNYTAPRIMEIFGVGRHSAAVPAAQAEGLAHNPEKLAERVYGAGNPRKMKELGNQPGDGYPFRGIGPLQSTGRGAAKRWGQKCAADFTADVSRMLAPEFVFLPSLFEWDSGHLNLLADRNNIRAIRRIINGGYNGMAEAEAWHAKAWAVMRGARSAPAAWQASMMDSATAHLQVDLNSLGYTPALSTDGLYGPATKEAVRWFQRLHGLHVDGVAGPVTNGKLELTLAQTRPVPAAA